MAGWRVKLSLEHAEDSALVAALLAECELGAVRLTTHLLDTADCAISAAGRCVRLRRTEPLGSQSAGTSAKFTVSIRPHERTLKDSLLRVWPAAQPE